jgi:hypothetical protein
MPIGTLSEKRLHAGLKTWLARPGDEVEVEVDGYVVDIVRGRQLIEVQTGGFSGFRVKLATLLRRHPVHIVLPVAAERTYLRGGKARRSPKRGRFVDAFAQLVGIAPLLMDPNLTIEVALVREEVAVEPGRAKRGWSPAQRRLLGVVGSATFSSVKDFQRLLPWELPAPFTVADLAKGWGCSRGLAGKAAYCLRHAGAIVSVGKRGNARLYELPDDAAAVTGSQCEQ